MQSKETEKYNGWTNYETWAVNLWISNVESSYRYWRKQAALQRKKAVECSRVKDGIWTEGKAAVFHLADQMRDEISEETPELEASVYSDLLSSALGEVNWEEIAGSWMEDD